MKIEEHGEGKVLIDCLRCGKMFEIDDWRSEPDAEWRNLSQRCLEACRICPDCDRAEHAAAEAERIAARSQIDLAKLPERIAAAGIPDHYAPNTPPCRFVAEFIWRSRKQNLLLSGITGSGKSTSACICAAKMIAQGFRVRYYSLRKLLAQWRQAKMSEGDVSERLLARLFRLDLLIIDEVIGKARVTDSGQELLFDLLESVNNGECHARVWLLGNFYTGSIEEVFSDPEPVRRRLQENFVCAVIDTPAQQVRKIKVWRGGEAAAQ